MLWYEKTGSYSDAAVVYEQGFGILRPDFIQVTLPTMHVPASAIVHAVFHFACFRPIFCG